MADTSLPDRIQTEDPSLVRDTHSKALLNTNMDALERHRRRVARSKESVSTLATLKARQDYLEQRLDHIAEALDTIVAFLKR